MVFSAETDFLPASLEIKDLTPLKKVAKKCRNVLMDFVRKPVEETVEAPANKLLKPCLAREVSLAPMDIVSRLQDCANIATKPNCNLGVSYGRAFLVRKLYSDGDPETQESSVLAARITGEIFSPADSRRDLNESEAESIRKLTRILLKRLPNNVDVVKAHFLTYVMTGAIERFSEPAMREPNEFLKASAAKFKDAQLVELTLWADSKRPDAINRILTFVKSHPELSFGHYVLAGTYWNEGKKDQAQRELEIARTIDQNNETYTQVLRKMNDPGFEGSPFTIGLKFNILRSFKPNDRT